MSHLDEGTLHALLDGELAGSEMMEIEAHLDGCTACSARLRAAREFLEEADRLVGSVQFGRFSAAPSPATAAATTPRHEKVTAAAAPPPGRQQPPPPPPPREHHKWEQPEEPVLLIPDNPEASPLLSRWPRMLGWAAALTFTVSAGFLINNLARETRTPAAGAPAAAGTVATVSPQETNAGLRAAPELRRDSSPSAPAASPDTATPKAAPKAPPTPRPADKQLAGSGAVAPKKTEPPKRSLSKDSAPKAPEIVLRTVTQSKPVNEATSSEDSADAAEEAATRAEEQEAIRVQAAKALSQLDRERRIQRANAATRALDRSEATQGLAPVAVAPPPPPTPEQKSQVYLRIGLDEASRQLGGPVHVIEGLSPLFMGLAPGRVTAGADTTRPVVRVVYQDPQGRLIMLDQQRNRPGQPATPPASGSWSLGDLMMRLSGEAPAEVLRSLRGRVR